MNKPIYPLPGQKHPLGKGLVKPPSYSASGIPSYDEWMQKTKLGVMKPRSTQLKKVDDAIKAYSKAPSHITQKAIRLAMADWIRSKGDGWKRSERNRDGIVEQVRTNVFTGWAPPMTPEERRALEFMEQQRRLAVQRMFVGKKLTLKLMNAVKEAKAAYGDVKKAGQELQKLGKGGAKAAASSGETKLGVDSMIADMFDVQTADALRGYLMDIFGEDLLVGLVPVVGHFASGGKVMMAWGKTAKSKYDQVQMVKLHGPSILPGDPYAAFQALDRMLQRNTTSMAVQASIQTTDFAARNLLALADGGAASGPVMGAATALSKFAHRLFLLGREYQETKAANKLLANPQNLGFRLFETAPILGCYMLASSTLSDILNMSAYQFAQPGWMDDVEKVRDQHIEPVRKAAFKFIQGSIYEVRELTPLVAKNQSLVGRAFGALG